MNLPVHIAIVEHMSGQDAYTDHTEDGLYKQVAAYCRSRWGTCEQRHIETPPDDDRKCVDLYFEDHDNDSLTTHIATVDVPPLQFPAVAEAYYLSVWANSLTQAISHAGGKIGTWDDLKGMTVEQLGRKIAGNGIEFTYGGQGQATAMRGDAAKAAAILQAAHPYL